MKKLFFLFLVFVLVSCSSDGMKRLVPVADEGSDETIDTSEIQDSDTFEPDGEDPVIEDDDPVETADNDPIVLPDVEPNDDNPIENDENPIPDEDDIETPLCGEVFNGSNCSASYCETLEDCCGSDICVATDACGGKKVCRNAFFKENFDSYPAESFPKQDWTLKYNGMGSNYQVVTSEKYVSDENSMRLLGSKGYNLSAVMTTVLPEVPNVINVEVKMNTEGDNVALSLCTFENEAPGKNWGNYDVKIEFADGKIRYQIPEWSAYDVTPSYIPNEWYKIRLKLNQIDETVSVWVNDELKVNNQTYNVDSLSIPNICLESNKNDKKVWFDDIFVWGE